MAKQFYTAQDLSEFLSVSESKAYGLIRIMNEELQNQGFSGSRSCASCLRTKKIFWNGGIK